MGSTKCCTVLLGVTVDGQKLPPLIISKGLHHGWIMQEFVGTAAEVNGYLEGQVYTVQERA